MPDQTLNSLLEGLTILDLADHKADFCSKLLADLGATVIKIERPRGCPSLRTCPSGELSSSGEDPSFLYHNTSKLGITLDIEKTEGREVFIKLLTKSDAVVESFPVGYLDTVGMSYEAMNAINPGLILVSVTGFGQTGPRSGYKSCDLVNAAFGGQMYVTGSPSSTPLLNYGEQSFYTASLFGALGILLALVKRRDTGKVDHIDISIQETLVSTLDHVLVRYLYDGVVAKRQGSLAWNRFSFILPCREGLIHMSIGSQWETLVEWVASEGMADDLTDERWKDEKCRFQEIHHIIHVLGKWTQTHTADELFETAQAMRFPWATVLTPEEVLQNEQLKARGFFVPVQSPGSGSPLMYPGPPYRTGGDCDSPSPIRTAPLMGEHNRQIYHDLLGLSDETIKRLSFSGVI